MSYNLRLLTAESRDLVVEALRAEAHKRTRVASRAALAVAEDRAAKRDVRSASVRVTALLAEAGRLDQLATELATAPDVPILSVQEYADAVDAKARAAITLAESTAISVPEAEQLIATIEEQLGDDDGLSEAAHAAMAQAEEFAARELGDPDDPTLDTGALGEDDPDDDEIEEVLT